VTNINLKFADDRFEEQWIVMRFRRNFDLHADADLGNNQPRPTNEEQQIMNEDRCLIRYLEESLVASHG